MKHKVLDLFSGIGGFSLGLQNTGGFETVAFCEIEPYCHKVLKKHWQDVPIYNDIKELNYDTLQADGIEPTVITGGFPCQDISVAGRQEGIIGERSSLWSEYARLIRDVRPAWAIIENVSALRSKGLVLVLQNLSEIGYNAEWHCIPCSSIGGLHRRDRIWIIAYPMENSRCTLGQRSFIEGENEDEVGEGNANQYQRSSSTSRTNGQLQTKQDVTNSMCEGLERSGFSTYNDRQNKEGHKGTYGSASKPSGLRGEPKHIVRREQIERFAQHAQAKWTVEPDVGRVAYGIPRRVDRLKGLGNAVVPQIPQFLGESILNFEKENI
jgi:DNA (cytosine-5)-methyltransferase 1